MSIQYIVRKKVNSLKGKKQELWYAVSKKLQKKGGKTEKDVARIVEQRTGFHRGEVLTSSMRHPNKFASSFSSKRGLIR